LIKRELLMPNDEPVVIPQKDFMFALIFMGKLVIDHYAKGGGTPTESEVKDMANYVFSETPLKTSKN
jgi:hypothetical protein